MWIASGDDPDALKGPNIGSAHIDEPFIQDEEVLNQTLARVRDPAAKMHEIGMTGTPEQLNWGYDVCEGDRSDDYETVVIRSSTKDNVTLDPEYYNRLESALTEEAAKAYLEGHFIDLVSGRVYYAMSDANFVELPDPGHELGVGMDFNVNPMAAAVFWRNGDHMHFIDEVELPNSDTQYMCSYLLDKYKDNEGNSRVRTIYPDASGAARSTKAPGGKSDFYYIRQAGLEIDAAPTNPLIRDRENTVNGKMNPKDGDITVTFDPKMKKIKSYMVKYTHEDRNKPKHKAMSHLLDATGYPIYRLFPAHLDQQVIKQISGF